MRYLLPLVVIPALACNTGKDQGPLSRSKENDVKTYFTTQIKQIDSTLMIDTFQLIRIDTLSQKDMYLGMIQQFYPEKEAIIENMRKILKEMKYNVKMVNLSNSLSSTLYRIYKSDRIQPTNFQAVFLYQIRKQDISAMKDIGYMLMNRNFDITDRKSFGSQLSTINSSI